MDQKAKDRHSARISNNKTLVRVQTDKKLNEVKQKIEDDDV